MRLSHLLIWTGIICLVPSTGSAQPFHFPEGHHGKSDLKYINGLPVLSISGSPEEIGEAVGVLALKPATPIITYPEDLLRHFHLGFLRQSFLNAGEKMLGQFPEDYRRELEAMARGGAVGREKLILGNTLFDLKKSVACSAFLVGPERSNTGSSMLGRNLDYPSLGYAHEYSLVTVYHPKGSPHAFATVGFPGLVGCLSGINDAGLSVAVLEVFHVKPGTKRIDRTGIPYALCYRRILERCSTIQEAKLLLESFPRTTITNLAIADRERVAVFEVTPRWVVERTPTAGICVSTNHFCSPELKPLVCLNIIRTTERFRILEAASTSEERFDIGSMQQLLDAVHLNDTLQTMIFEPTTLRLHLAIGTCPSSEGELKTLDLSALFSSNKP